MKRFWIILAVVVLGMVTLFVFTDKSDDSSKFSGDAKQIQSDDHVRNQAGLPVTLIEYGDFQCPVCGTYYPILRSLEETYKEKVTFVFRHFPLRSVHANAQAAALAAEAASKQGKFFEMHDKLFETQNSWGGTITASQQATYEDYAQELGLDMNQFKIDYASAAVANRINRDVSSGSQFGITGTPTFILNGEKIENPAATEAAFKKVLDDAISKAGGTPPTQQ